MPDFDNIYDLIEMLRRQLEILTSNGESSAQRIIHELDAIKIGIPAALGELKAAVDAVKSGEAIISSQLAQILALLSPQPAVAISFEFSSQPRGEVNMPLTMPANTVNEKYFIIGKDASGLTGAALATGQTLTVVSADPNTVVITPDASPAIDNESVQSVGSGGVAAGPTPVLGSPITVTATVLNADGSTAESITDTVTITAAVPGVATSIGELFEVPVAGVTPPAGGVPAGKKK